MNLSIKEPTLIKLKRLKRGLADFEEEQSYIGYLTNALGINVPTPIIGEPIYLCGDESPDWMFASDPVYRLDTFDAFWRVVTEKGEVYEIENARHFH
jgi:hypothetical protein